MNCQLMTIVTAEEMLVEAAMMVTMEATMVVVMMMDLVMMERIIILLMSPVIHRVINRMTLINKSGCCYKAATATATAMMVAETGSVTLQHGG